MKRLLKIFKYLLVILSLTFVSLGANDNVISLTLQNPTNLARIDEYFQLKINITAPDTSILIKEYTGEDFILLINNLPVPFQYEKDIYGDRYIGFVTDFAPQETKTLVIKPKEKSNIIPEPKSRTYAELAMKVDYKMVNGKYTGGHFENFTKVTVPHTHKDHDALFKYEGPGWESELVGYRFYLDQRNSTDIFGKKKNGLVLKDVGVNDIYAQDDSYHNMQSWGMDIFNVGASLGIGTIGMWYDNKVYKVSTTDSIICELKENGPIKSEVRTDYYGWQVGKEKFNLSSALSITAGSRLTKCDFKIDGNPENLVTGLAKFEGTRFSKSLNEKGWNYIALYGKQSLAEDSLGIAVVFNANDFIENLEDQVSYIIKLKPDNGKLSYYFCAAWEQEPKGIKNQKEFIDYLNELVEKLNNPIIRK